MTDSLTETPAPTQIQQAPRRRLRLFQLFSLTLTVLLVVVIAYPLITMVIRQLFPGWDFNSTAFERVLNDPEFWASTRNTAILIVVPGIFALAIGGMLAWLSERSDIGMVKLTGALPVVSLILPPVALSIGWVFLGDRTVGLLNLAIRWVIAPFGLHPETGPIDIYSWGGMIWVYVIYFVPFAFLMIAPALRNIDPALEEASRMSGASPFGTLWRVSLPAVLPAIGASWLLMIVLGLAQFSFGRTIGVTSRIDVLSVYIVKLFQSYPSHADEAVVVGLIVLVAVAITWVLQERFTSRRAYATISGRANTAVRVRLGGFRWPARILLLGYFAVATVLPFLALLLVAIQPFWNPQIDVRTFTMDNFIDIAMKPYTRTALLDSIGLGLGGATIAIIVAALLAVYAAGRGGKIMSFVGGVARSPGAISHIVLAVAFLIAFGGPPTYWAGTLLILVLAYVIINMPQAWIAASSSVEQVGKELIDASLLSGASMGDTFRLIVLPLISRGLISGWAFVFVVIVGDLTASAILASTNTPVVGFVILDVFDNGTYSEVAALGSVISVITAAIVLIVLRVSRPRFRAASAA